MKKSIILCICFLVTLIPRLKSQEVNKAVDNSNKIFRVSIADLLREQKQLYDIDASSMLVVTDQDDDKSMLFFKYTTSETWETIPFDKNKKGYLVDLKQLLQPSKFLFLEFKYQGHYGAMKIYNSEKKKLRSVEIVPRSISKICKDEAVIKVIYYEPKVEGGIAPYKYKWSIHGEKSKQIIFKEKITQKLEEMEGIEIKRPLNYIVKLLVIDGCGHEKNQSISLSCERERIQHSINLFDGVKDGNGKY